ncbi:MAG: M1 family metallopeptidase, partial [Bryobacteraceae bacterium]
HGIALPQEALRDAFDEVPARLTSRLTTRSLPPRNAIGGMRTALLALLLPVLTLAQTDRPVLRLPDTVAPVSYEAELGLTPGVDEFKGWVSIDVEVRRATAVVWLHAKDLTLKGVRVGEAAARVDVSADDFVAITPERMLQPGRTRIAINYTGKMSRVLTEGIFHQHHRGDWYTFTKFEPTTARRAFPCFDEPSFKTPWQLTLRVPSGLQAFSNTPVHSERDEGDGTKSVSFAQTKPLPTYLVALAVGPFEVVDAGLIGRNRVPARIIVPQGRAAEAAFAAENTARAVQLLEDYFGVAYPYEKLDQVVAPFTTAWGAVENAGLIVYGEVCLLAKPDQDTIAAQRGRLDLMVHEIAHQWFGNLVTMEWWNDLWLNEGFASWIASKLVDRWHPEWKAETSAVARANAAKTSDALVSSPKVRQPIGSPADIALAFNGITYLKGAALLRMFENWLGEETFRRGVQAYIARYAWKNATTQDLLFALSKSAGRDVSAAFSSFLDEGGIPLLTANVRCGGKRPMLELGVEQFLPVGSAGSGKGRWRLPVCVRLNGSRECFELSAERQQFELKTTATCPEWFYANENGAGYYRVTHEGRWSDRLVERGAPLSNAEALTLLQDVGALVAAGRADAGEALALARHFSDSEEREVLAAAIGIARKLSEVLPDELLPSHSRFVRSWLGDRANHLGWEPKEGESEDTRLIRLALVPFVAIEGRDEELARAARRLADRWLVDRSSVHRDVAPLALLVAARYGDRRFFDRLVSELRRSGVQRDRYYLVFALAAFPDANIMRAALDLVLNGGPGLDPREVRGVISSQWRETRATVWEYVKDNFDRLNANLPGARGIPFGAELPQIGARFCDEARAGEVEAFFTPRIASVSGGQRNLEKSVESVHLCSARRVALEAGLRTFLSKR